MARTDVPSPSSPRVLVVAVTADDYPAALAVARELRALPEVHVEQDVRLRGVKAALRHADRTGADLVMIVGERERAEDQVVVRNMRTREERTIPRSEAVAAVQAVLA